MSTTHTPPSTYILRELIDVETAPEITFVPQTLGWKIVAALLVAAAIYFGFKAINKWWHNRYRAEAIQAIEQIDLKQSNSARELYRVARIVLTYANPSCSGSFGQRFLQDLDAQCDSDGASELFDSEQGRAWVRSLEDPNYALELAQRQALKTQIVKWIKQHNNKRHTSTKISSKQGAAS